MNILLRVHGRFFFTSQTLSSGGSFASKSAFLLDFIHRSKRSFRLTSLKTAAASRVPSFAVPMKIYPRKLFLVRVQALKCLSFFVASSFLCFFARRKLSRGYEYSFRVRSLNGSPSKRIDDLLRVDIATIVDTESTTKFLYTKFFKLNKKYFYCVSLRIVIFRRKDTNI